MFSRGSHPIGGQDREVVVRCPNGHEAARLQPGEEPSRRGEVRSVTCPECGQTFQIRVARVR